jgi:hypothetical protein
VFRKDGTDVLIDIFRLSSQFFVTWSNRELAIGFSFQLLLEFGEDVKAALLELADPVLGDLVDCHGVEAVQFFAANYN